MQWPLNLLVEISVWGLNKSKIYYIEGEPFEFYWKILIELCFFMFTWQMASFGSGYSLVPNRWQTIILTSVDQVL